MSEMTATRIGWLARIGMVIVLVAAWVVGGTRLWRTSVPSSLRTDGLDMGRFFTSAQLQEAHRFSLFLELDWLLGTVATLVALVVLAVRLRAVAGRIGLGPIGSGVIVGMVTLTTLFLVGLPFAFAAQWWRARHGIAPRDYLSWLTAPWATLASEATFALVAIAVVMALARRLGRAWWVAGAPAFVALAVGFAFVQGYSSESGTTALKPAYRAEVAALKRREHVHVPVRQLKVSDWTHEANAFAVGIGPSTRVVLWDTLLDGRFSRGEVDVVVAHELGHVARRHIWKGLGWLALLAFPVAFLLAEATRPVGGLGRPAAIPLAFLVLTLASLVASPVENAVSRRYEAEADWAALQTTRDPAAATALFRGFARTSLEEPNPPGWAYVLLENHPTLAQRIAMAQRWRAAAVQGAVATRRGAAAPRAGS
jgi:STE24 endopeptidase